MTDQPIQFPSYHEAPKPLGPKFAHPLQAKPLLKLMTRAFRGKMRKGLFTHAKRKKVKIV